MPSPITPTHGKLAAIWRHRPGGYIGQGLNDATWGTGFSGAASAYFEVVIDAESAPDTYKWRKDGGAWTSGVAITGAAQTLSDGQQITFAATTGHSLNDSWCIGNLKDEPTTESGDEAQITAAARRILNPNSPATFTDAGGAAVIETHSSRGWAKFAANVGVVDVDGNDGYVPAAALEKMGYLFEWEFTAAVKMADASRMGQQWEESLPGLANFNGSAGAYYIGCDTFFAELEDVAAGGRVYTLLSLSPYDPDQDGTGDRWNCWAQIEGLNAAAPIGDIVKEKVTFKGSGMPGFVANS